MDVSLLFLVVCSLVAAIVVFISFGAILTRSNILSLLKISKPKETNVFDLARCPCSPATFDKIVNEFVNLKEISLALKNAGLETCQLVIGIDFTASNEWQGRRTFSQKSLHAISEKVEERSGRRGSHHNLGFLRNNPYQKVISILGETLEPFDEDQLIPAFGFGDSVTKDNSVFPLSGDVNVPCNGFRQVLTYYKEVLHRITLSGPTNFVPIINKAIEIIKKTKQYHILVIIADGQVSKVHQQATRQAIIKASWYPLSIIFVGVGDGPWRTMTHYDDQLRGRKFDNFQFVDYHEVTRKGWRPELTFSLHALMEIPEQYKAIKALGLIDML